MKKNLQAGLIATTLILPTTLMAEGGFSDITWVPQAGVQMKTLEFEQKLKASTQSESGEGSLKVEMPTLSASLTGVYQQFYVSLKYEDSFDDASADSTVPNTESETKMERTDYSITLGYNIYENMNIFVGYMDGETTLRPVPRCPASAPGTAIKPNPVCGVGGVGLPSVDGNKAQDNTVLLLDDYEQKYKEDGLFAGMSYVWRFEDYGNLSVSAAYAHLEATYTDNWLVGSPEFANRPFAFDFEGDADGLSLGLNWSAALTDHVGYYFDLRRQSYDMTATQSFEGRPANITDPAGALQTRRVETEETITAYTAGIQWYF